MEAHFPDDATWRLAVPKSLQAAVYEGTRERPSYYRRHTDATRGARLCANNPRRLTCILYLNPAWDGEKHGGALRVYHPHANPERYVDVQPIAGRLVVFDSTIVEHEVRPTYGTRWALTMWAGFDENRHSV